MVAPRWRRRHRRCRCHRRRPRRRRGTSAALGDEVALGVPDLGSAVLGGPVPALPELLAGRDVVVGRVVLRRELLGRPLPLFLVTPRRMLRRRIVGVVGSPSSSDAASDSDAASSDASEPVLGRPGGAASARRPLGPVGARLGFDRMPADDSGGRSRCPRPARRSVVSAGFRSRRARCGFGLAGSGVVLMASSLTVQRKAPLSSGYAGSAPLRRPAQPSDLRLCPSPRARDRALAATGSLVRPGATEAPGRRGPSHVREGGAVASASLRLLPNPPVECQKKDPRRKACRGSFSLSCARGDLNPHALSDTAT